jgi:hypothetical protein
VLRGWAYDDERAELDREGAEKVLLERDKEDDGALSRDDGRVTVDRDE